MSRVVHRRQPDVIRGADEHRSAIRFNPNWRLVSDERQIRLHELMRNEFGNNDWKRGQIGYKSIRNRSDSGYSCHESAVFYAFREIHFRELLRPRA